MSTTNKASLSELVYPELKTTNKLNPDATAPNFHVWKTKLNFVLLDNNVDYVLTDSNPPSPEDDAVAHRKFRRDDSAARHIILGTLHDDLFMCYHHHDTAKSLMDALTGFFAKPSLPRKMAAFMRYKEHRFVEGTDIKRHIVEMGGLARELELEGMKMDECSQMAILINTLPEKWKEQIDLEIENMERNGEFSLENLCNKLRIIGEVKDCFKARAASSR